MAYLALQENIDAAAFREMYIDNAIRSNTEGGYVKTRPRHTRGQLKKFQITWTDVSDADKEVIQSFFETVYTYSELEFTHPTEALDYSVRFEAPPDFKYIGAGTNYRWTITAVLVEI